MKRIILSLFLVLLALSMLAQTPQSFKYQSVVRTSDGTAVIANQTVAFRISILQGSSTGAPVYVETQSVLTNQFGIATFNIGEGTSGDDFTAIEWSTGLYWVKVEIDPANGTAFEEVGTSKLLSVPYALYAKSSEDSFNGDYNELNNLPTAPQTDTTNIVKLTSADEDYIDFGTFEGFTNSSDWSIIERVMMPAGTGAISGYQFFRGKGWEDKEGDIMVTISTTQVNAMFQKNGWQNLAYVATFNEETWYDICVQYDATATTLYLYLDGTLVDQQTGVSPQDDSGNTNNLFWGGQDVDPVNGQGYLYLEKDVIIASQQWLQRKLTEAEISNYSGYIEPETALFFSSNISSASVTDGSGNGHNGTNGNTPEYSNEVIYLGSEENEPVNISGVSSYGTVEANTFGLAAALFMNSDGNYEEADADDVATMPCVALALETGTGNKKILLQGYITNELWGWTPGQPVYVSPATGELTQPAPSSSDQQVQIVGYASKANTIYFNPNLMLLELN